MAEHMSKTKPSLLLIGLLSCLYSTTHAQGTGGTDLVIPERNETEAVDTIEGQAAEEVFEEEIEALQPEEAGEPLRPSAGSLKATGTGTLDEIVVRAAAPTDGVSADIAEQQLSSGVADVIGQEQFSLVGAGDASSALSRVTGLSVIDGQYVYVRGLGERYSSTLFNGAVLPSPEPTRRVVPLDLFPTNILGSILVQKTFSADLPADFSGGLIELRSRQIPNDFQASVGLSIGVNSETLENDGFTYAGGDTDFLGVDDDTRDLPSSISTLTESGSVSVSRLDTESNEIIGESFDSTLNTKSENLGPDVGFNVAASNSFGDEVIWGYDFAFLYNREGRYRSETRNDFSLVGDGSLDVETEETLQRSEISYQLGGMLNLQVSIYDEHIITLNNFVSRQTSDTTLISDGFEEGNDLFFQEDTLEWIERELSFTQLEGVHILPDAMNIKVDWHITTAEANRDQPDKRELRYVQEARDGADAPFELAVSTQAGRNPLTRSWEFLDDETDSFGLGISLPIDISDSVATTIGLGADGSTRERDFDVFSYEFDLASPIPSEFNPELLAADPETAFAPDNIGPNGFTVRNANLLSDSYNAGQDILAFYINADTYFGDQFRLLLGVRSEDSDINITTSSLSDPDQNDTVALDDDDILPNIVFTTYLGERQQIRIGYSETVNRPEFRELSEVNFTDPDTRFITTGNENLIQSDITNLDIRYEFYFTNTELFSIAYFRKDFDNPIERTVGGASGQNIRTFINADSAFNQGVEISLRKEFYNFENFLNRFFTSLNLTVIDSEVEIREDSLLTNDSRSLQGQSDVLFNGILGYDYKGTSASLLINYVGESIFDAGSRGLPDVFQEELVLVDLVFSQDIGESWNIGAKVNNIFDPDIDITQGGEQLISYNRGISFSVGASYSFY